MTSCGPSDFWHISREWILWLIQYIKLHLDKIVHHNSVISLAIPVMIVINLSVGSVQLPVQEVTVWRSYRLTWDSSFQPESINEWSCACLICKWIVRIITVFRLVPAFLHCRLMLPFCSMITVSFFGLMVRKTHRTWGISQRQWSTQRIYCDKNYLWCYSTCNSQGM